MAANLTNDENFLKNTLAKTVVEFAGLRNIFIVFYEFYQNFASRFDRSYYGHCGHDGA
jgi:hypothetical protein